MQPTFSPSWWQEPGLKVGYIFISRQLLSRSVYFIYVFVFKCLSLIICAVNSILGIIFFEKVINFIFIYCTKKCDLNYCVFIINVEHNATNTHYFR